jgi:hypothetical protein
MMMYDVYVTVPTRKFEIERFLKILSVSVLYFLHRATNNKCEDEELCSVLVIPPVTIGVWAEVVSEVWVVVVVVIIRWSIKQ